MLLAVGFGALIASGRVYGGRPLQVMLTAYVEVIRGTPLLLQLFVLYFGLAPFVQLPAFLAGVIGLGLNYAAYESEIYRSALEAVPAGQLDAARTLGFSRRQTLMLVRGPQAFRFALAPMTNDFVALLKDSSLVSVITVVELTKQTSDLRGEHRQLARPGHALRRPLSRAVAAAGAPGPPHRKGLAARMTTLQLRDVEIRRGGRVIVQGVSFSADRGERLAIMGPSGSGKTTVLRGIAGLDSLAAGAVDVGRVGMVFQFHHLFEHLTAVHNVWLAPVHVLRQPRVDAERRAHEILGMLGVADRASALPHQMSGGEAQRVAIARALAVDPPVLLMDEPTASLDPARRGELAATLRQLASQGRTVVVSTHDSDFARSFADRIVVLEGGRVVATGMTRDLLS